MEREREKSKTAEGKKGGEGNWLQLENVSFGTFPKNIFILTMTKYLVVM